MNRFITPTNNRLAHKIKRLHPRMAWSRAFNLALMLEDLDEMVLKSFSSSVFGEWSDTNLKSVAGHFWGLSHAYDELGDRGRAISMKKLSKTLYAIHDAKCKFSFSNLIEMRGVSDKLLTEVVSFYISAKHFSFTPRTHKLVAQGAKYHSIRVSLPVWDD